MEKKNENLIYFLFFSIYQRLVKTIGHNFLKCMQNIQKQKFRV